MYETRIAIDKPLSAGTSEPLAPVHAMLATLAGLVDARRAGISPGSAEDGASPTPLATRYMAASPIARRRFDAILHEAETIGTTGLQLITRRNGKIDAGTIAAARFLGNSLERTLRQLEDILPTPAA
jgi:hypothetical protein